MRRAKQIGEFQSWRVLIKPPNTYKVIRLYSESIPVGQAAQKALAEVFFRRVHPLRSLGFIHKPSFMRSLDHRTLVEDYGEALVSMVCALGARYASAQTVSGQRIRLTYDRLTSLDDFGEYIIGSPAMTVPGTPWVKHARRLIFENIERPSVHNMMVSFLLRPGDTS